MISSETIHCMALSMLLHSKPELALELLRAAGSARAISENRRDLRAVAPEASDKMCKIVEQMDTALQRAETEAEFAEKRGIACVTIADNAYPARLRDCADAPPVLYFKGNADLNAKRVVSVVGTRHCTEYGKNICERLTRELASIAPDTIIVSGLAYGIDINAHRGALSATLPTLAVLAHGLDRIYPASHRNTAKEMLSCGGLITEFPSGTVPDKFNFVRRNRIIAGLADVTVVVESAAKGGGLITASIAQSYGRDVCAFPGRAGDEYSAGCNNLIRSNCAQLITSAENLVEAMLWNDRAGTKAAAPRERDMFPDLTPEEQRIIDALSGTDEKQLNILTVETNIPVGKLMSLLFELEMRGLVKSLSGARYCLR